eukprot:276431-Pleurochrysis_carterae.AAC.1
MRFDHIDRRHFFVRELVEIHKISTDPFVCSADNFAEFYTLKPLTLRLLPALRNKIKNIAQQYSLLNCSKNGVFKTDPSPRLLYSFIYIHPGFITPSPARPATLACTHATGQRPQ